MCIRDRNIYVDRISGRSFDRPSYNLLVGTSETAALLRQGDLLIMTSIDRMGRDYTEIKREWQRLTEELKVDVKILDMPLLDTSSFSVEFEKTTLEKKFISDLVLQILSYVAEKERKQIKKNQKDGIEVARKAGKQIGRPKLQYPENWKQIYTDWQDGKLTTSEAVQEAGVEKRSFYNLAKRYERANNIQRKRYYNINFKD